MPPPNEAWSEKLWPIEYPLTTNEMSILLPHMLKDGRGKLEVYFSRVYNPLWVNPTASPGSKRSRTNHRSGCTSP